MSTTKIPSMSSYTFHFYERDVLRDREKSMIRLGFTLRENMGLTTLEYCFWCLYKNGYYMYEVVMFHMQNFNTSVKNYLCMDAYKMVRKPLFD